MAAYVIRRFLTLVPIVFGVMLLTFVLFRFIGGNPAYRIAGKNADAKRIAELTHLNGYDKPLLFGYWANEITDEESADGVTVTGGGSKKSFSLKPEQGSVTFGVAVMEPGYEKRYRFSFRIAAPKGGTLRVSRELHGVEGAPNEVLVEKSLAAFPEFQNISMEVVTPAQPPEPAVITEENVPEQLTFGFRIEFTGDEATINSITALRHQEHWYDAQLWMVMGKLCRFDFGQSTNTKQKVITLFKRGVIPTLCVTVPSFFITLILTISISLICAYKRNSFTDRSLVVLSVVGMSINGVILCVLIQNWAGTDAKLFGFPLGLQHYGIPIWGFEGARYLILPLVIATVTGLGGGVRLYRTIMLNERYSEYVRTATAKGCSDRSILFAHILKNAMIPILTNVVIGVLFLYTGTLLLENFFGIPGVGFLTVQAIGNQDEPVLYASVFIGTIVFVVANLLTDIAYALVDPRVRLK